MHRTQIKGSAFRPVAFAVEVSNGLPLDPSPAKLTMEE